MPAPKQGATPSTVKNEGLADAFEVKEVGLVEEVREGILARIVGLPSCLLGQLVSFASLVQGMVVGCNPEEVHALLLGDASQVQPGEQVRGALRPFRIPVGSGFLGRIVNSLGAPLDGKGPIAAEASTPLFRKAPGIMERVPITRPLETGIKILDTMIPIGKGQRELILGDRMTGKTTLALDTVLNAQGRGVLCIYCLIGRSVTALLQAVQFLQASGSMGNTLVVAETASAPPGRQFLAPYAACAFGEFLMEQGKDVLVVFDDLTRHAWIHRQVSLILGRPAGKEAYPGDMFYLHSQLMERACALSKERGGGSMTFLPIVETQQGDVTGTIPSNVISMTDGQIYLSTHLFAEGFKPAIDLGLSVSRLGSKVQSSALREVSRSLRLEYLQLKELEQATKLRAFLSAEARGKLRQAAVLKELLVQDKHRPVSTEEQILLFSAYAQGMLKERSMEEVRRFKGEFYGFLKQTDPGFIEALRGAPTLTGQIQTKLREVIQGFFSRNGEGHDEQGQGTSPGA